MISTRSSTKREPIPLKKDSFLGEILRPEKINTIQTPEFLLQHRTLCAKYHSVEWSGIIGFTMEGDVTKDPSSVKIVLHNIFPMDIGSAGYTEYAFDGEAANFRMNYPDYSTGHAHSHNNMKVFFSHTDVDELYENTEQFLHYLSVIVNNKNDITGRLCYVASTVNSTFTTEDLDGKYQSLKFDIGSSGIKNKLLIMHECEFVSPYPEWWNTQIEHLDKKIAAAIKPTPRSYYPQTSFKGLKPGEFERLSTKASSI